MDSANVLETYDPVPVGNIHIESLKLARKQYSVVSDKVASLLYLVHSLRKPMLRRDNVFKAIPFGYNYLPKVTEINKTQYISLLALQPRIL